MSLESAKREVERLHAEKMLLTTVADQKAKQLCKEFAQQAQSARSLPIYTRIERTNRFGISRRIKTHVGSGWSFPFLLCPGPDVYGFLTITTDGIPVAPLTISVG